MGGGSCDGENGEGYKGAGLPLDNEGQALNGGGRGGRGLLLLAKKKWGGM